jgi:uncharacterized protein YqjF (DUF2071 family)
MMTPEDIVQHVDHRPWALPVHPWAGRMRWCDLAFLHWPLEPSVIRPLIPTGLELETFDGKAWLGVVPFRMADSRVRFLPAIPGLSDFAELNVRTYVRAGERFGVWFFSFDAANPVAVRGARTLFNLPYYDASMAVDNRGDVVAYRSRRTHSDAPAAEFVAEYAPVGPVYHAESGTLDYFLTERYCLFNQNRSGELGFLDVHHLPWPLQPATCTIQVNTMAAALGIALPDEPPLAHFAGSLDVVAWTRELLRPAR